MLSPAVCEFAAKAHLGERQKVLPDHGVVVRNHTAEGRQQAAGPSFRAALDIMVFIGEIGVWVNCALFGRIAAPSCSPGRS